MSIYTDTILPPRETRGLPRWGIAALIVLALHIALGAYIIFMHRPTGLSGVPADTVVIDLAPVATSPAQPQEVAAPPQEEPKPEPKTEPESEPPTPQPPLRTVPETPTMMTPPPPPLEQPVAESLQTPTLPPVPQAEVVLPPPPETKPAPDKMLEQKRIEQQRRQKERAERRKERARAVAHEKAAQAARRAAGPAPGATRQSASSWANEVQARVNAAKRYPESARARGESGTATLAFTVDAGGRVVSARIAGSSGSSDLDSATLAMAHRLGRLPPPPNGRVTLRVRVNYSVR